VAEHAESKDHHGYRYSLANSDFRAGYAFRGGITKNDIEMARDIDGIVAD
jgi:4a-hydroxytetrahydrobiopterin dehydratase